jgi:hypothetical protein
MGPKDYCVLPGAANIRSDISGMARFWCLLPGGCREQTLDLRVQVPGDPRSFLPRFSRIRANRRDSEYLDYGSATRPDLMPCVPDRDTTQRERSFGPSSGVGPRVDRPYYWCARIRRAFSACVVRLIAAMSAVRARPRPVRCPTDLWRNLSALTRGKVRTTLITFYRPDPIGFPMVSRVSCIA